MGLENRQRELQTHVTAESVAGPGERWDVGEGGKNQGSWEDGNARS